MKLVEFPHYLSLDQYEQSIDSMVNRLRGFPGVRTIYQIGGVSTPGVSDIDLLVVFEDGASCDQNPLRDLSSQDRYLYIHRLFGMSQSHFRDSFRYVFFHSYNHLWGERQEIPAGGNELEDAKRIKGQAGLEYLIKLYISMTVERVYRIVKVRNLLLHGKALLYDLADLEITSGRLPELLATMIEWRSRWFDERPRRKNLIQWLDDFYNGLKAELSSAIIGRKFFVPNWASLRISRNMRIVSSNELGYRHTGFTLPEVFGGIGEKYFNVQHRFNRFEFHVPITADSIPRELSIRHEFITMLNEYNDRYLPYFVPVAYGLPIFTRGVG
jgi:hypothetical protein